MTLPSWQKTAWNGLATALESGRLHHALLFAAPAGFGKRELADAFATAALCTSRDARGHACGHCRSCVLLVAGSHPDRVRISFESRDDGKPRSEIVVEQMRALSQRFAMSSQFGGRQIALIDPADRLNANAANALLKTLEEPSAATVIALIADDASRLPATIRSRCQRVEVGVPTHAEALAWLRANAADGARADAALHAALGNPGLALRWLSDETLALRDACTNDLAALSRGRDTAAAVAERWTADRIETRLWIAATLVHAEARRIASGAQSAFGLTSRREIPKLTAWFGRANRARGLLATTLRAELVVLDLMMAWPPAARGI